MLALLLSLLSLPVLLSLPEPTTTPARSLCSRVMRVTAAEMPIAIAKTGSRLLFFAKRSCQSSLYYFFHERAGIWVFRVGRIEGEGVPDGEFWWIVFGYSGRDGVGSCIRTLIKGRLVPWFALRARCIGGVVDLNVFIKIRVKVIA